MPDHVLQVETGHINMAPYAAQHTARHFFKAYLDFQNPDKFSLVPYFLCCKAMELAMKSIHLETDTKEDVRKYNHNLKKLYLRLPHSRINLSSEEYDLLVKANNLYSGKDFEYHNTAVHMAHGYSTFPDLNALAKLARKVTGYNDLNALAELARKVTGNTT